MAFDRNPGDLPQIPVIDCGRAGPVRLAQVLPAHVATMLKAARGLYTRPVLAGLDRRSEKWLSRNRTPYAGEIEEIALTAGGAGVRALNISYEWACTTSTCNAMLRRTLDWPFPGLGANLVVANCDGAAGRWLNVTWPGFVGALTALAPGRFAAALNQAPLRKVSGLLPVDWMIDRIKVDRSTDLPSTHVLRQAFETCRDYAAAVKFLSRTPMALPALFVLAGPNGEATLIERQERTAIVHEGPGAMANHWLSPDWHGRPRGAKSQERQQSLLDHAEANNGSGDFDWVAPPVLNQRTRLAVTVDVRSGKMAVMGLEKTGATVAQATAILRLTATESGSGSFSLSKG